MTPTPKRSRWSLLLVLSVILLQSSCCEDTVYTYDDAVQQFNQQREQLRRLTVQRNVAEKKLALDRRMANTTANPAEFLRNAQLEHDQKAADLDGQIAAERSRLRTSEGLLASMRPRS